MKILWCMVMHRKWRRKGIWCDKCEMYDWDRR